MTPLSMIQSALRELKTPPQPQVGYILDLEDDSWFKIEKRARWSIKKARKHLQILPGTLGELKSLHWNPLYLPNKLNENQQIFTAYYKNLPVSSILIERKGNKIIYSKAASNKKYNHLNGNSLLLWHIVEVYGDSDLLHLDLGGSKKKSIALFKRQFATRNYKYYPTNGIKKLYSQLKFKIKSLLNQPKPQPPSNLESFNNPKAVEIYSKKNGLMGNEQVAFKHLKPKSRVLDIGCGTGRTSKWLHENGFDVLAIDNAPLMIDKAKELNPDIKFEVQDAVTLKYPDKSFDNALFSFNGLDYVYPEQQRINALREINRVLKKDGLLIFSSHNRHWLNLPSRRRLKRTRHYENNYYTEKTVYGKLVTYYINPNQQEIQLRNNHFNLTHRYGHNFYDPWIHYIAQKKGERV